MNEVIEQYQCKAIGRFKSTDKAEVISFMFKFGPMVFICIVSIPSEGRDTAPVYIKVEFNTDKTSEWVKAK